MARITMVFGVLLILLGVGAYGLAAAGVIGDKASWTALLPAIFGLVLVICGAIGLRSPTANKHAMHVAVIIGLLGFLGTVGGVIKLVRYLTDSLPSDAPVRPSAFVAQTIMAILMALFVALCVRSFIAARKARQIDVGPLA